MIHRVPIEDAIDLHAFAPRDVVSVAEEYVAAAHAAGLREVRLIHGRGTGVQRALVQRALARHPLVLAIRDDHDSRLGATIARLRDWSGTPAPAPRPVRTSCTTRAQTRCTTRG